MRNTETYFEQVPIEVVETVLHQTAVLASVAEKPPAPASVPEHQAEPKFPSQTETPHSKGQL